MNHKLEIISQVWNKDSNLLFDYESNDYTITHISVKNGGSLIRNDKRISFVPGFINTRNDFQKIGNIIVNGDEFHLNFENNDNDKVNNLNNLTNNDKAWLVIRSTYCKNKFGFKLKDGDYMKLGKVVFKVKEIKIQDNEIKNKERTQCENIGLNSFNVNHQGNVNVQCNINANEVTTNINNAHSIINGTNNISNHNLNINDNNLINLIIQKNKNAMKRKLNHLYCRICLSEENDKENPLFNPCKCSGSMKYIHLLCIRNWFKSKTSTKVCNFLIVHSFKTPECEICKSILPEKVKVKGIIYNIVDLQRPESNYIILESISKEKTDTRFLYIIHMKEKTSISLGRSNESDVRISDISVSRNHAFIKLINNNFYLEDNLSKFGSLIQINGDITFLPYKQISLQIGKSCLYFNLKKTLIAWLCCYTKFYSQNEFVDYNQLLEKIIPIDEKEDIIECNYTNPNLNEEHIETPRNIIVLEEEKINKEEFKSQEEVLLIDKSNKQRKLEIQFLDDCAKDDEEIYNSVRVDNTFNRNMDKKESELVGKELNETRLNLTNFNQIEEMNGQIHYDKKEITNINQNENNIEKIDENDNTLNKTFKQFLEDIPQHVEVPGSSISHRNKPKNKFISNENLQNLLQSQVMNTNTCVGLNNFIEHPREEYPDQNLVFSNVIKFEEKTNEEKDDLNNLTQVFVDKIFKKIKINDVKETVEVKLDEQRFLEDIVNKRGKNNLMNISDNIYLESIDESKIHK